MKVNLNRRGIKTALGAMVVCILGLCVLPAHAATITVTANAADVLNGANASCSLWEAIQNINDAATTYADTPPAGQQFRQ